jgi:fatty acid-binding protein DegV
VQRVLVVTDSSTCLPEEVVQAFNVCVLPISNTTDDGAIDEDDLARSGNWQLPGELVARELEGANHPFVTEYLDAIESPGYEATVIVTPAIEFATMYRNAALAVELASRPTALIDARTAAAGQALVVLAAARAAKRGAALEEVVRITTDAAHRVELAASLATLEPLLRAGPVPAELLRSAQRTGARNVFRMRNGEVSSLGSTATPAESLALISEAYLESTRAGVEGSVVFHAIAPTLAEDLKQRLGGVDFVTGFSVAMQVHTGLGVVGAAWLPVSED